jgi:hypothetical protein
MAKTKRTNNDLQLRLNIELHEPHYATKNRGWTQVLWKGKQFLRH